LATADPRGALQEPIALAERLLGDARLPGLLNDRLIEVRDAWAEAAGQERRALVERLAEGRLPPHGGPSRGVAQAVVAQRLSTATDPLERRRLLDWLLASPNRAVIPALLAACDQPWAQQRAMPVLSLRFGQKLGTDWPGWRRWLQSQASAPELDRLLGSIAPGPPAVGRRTARARVPRRASP
jgi:hypothetical protein